MGVFLTIHTFTRIHDSLPHARGGVSFLGFLNSVLHMSSPRTWGCFHADEQQVTFGIVFPTHVGVFLDRPIRQHGFDRLPHARGGVSFFTKSLLGNMLSSPRTWGCFSRPSGRRYCVGVFPTHVGVFPPCSVMTIRSPRLPHARGGVSEEGREQAFGYPSSPRTWGCFLISSISFFIASSLPHARGGVSILRTRCMTR